MSLKVRPDFYNIMPALQLGLFGSRFFQAGDDVTGDFGIIMFIEDSEVSILDDALMENSVPAGTIFPANYMYAGHVTRLSLTTGKAVAYKLPANLF